MGDQNSFKPARPATGNTGCLKTATSEEKPKPLPAQWKTRIVLLLLAVMSCLRCPLAAQTFTTLHSFAAAIDYTNGSTINGDGAAPLGDLIVSGNTLYGTTVEGGRSAMGTIFKLNTDGTGFTNLYTFTGIAAPDFTNSDGINPQAALTLSGNTLYGTCVGGGAFNRGTVFKVNTDGTGFTTLYSFAGSDYGDGAYPYGGLVLASNILYGTTLSGGGAGTVFAINTDGTGYNILYSFSGSDGNGPWDRLILSGNTLYGTAGGGAYGSGTVFAINTDGTGFTTLYNFTANPGPSFTNIDGAGPYDGLMLSSNVLYGTTIRGGSSNNGTVFAIETSGTGFRTLHSFTGGSDGGLSGADLILSDGTLYGTTQSGGGFGNGTVFAGNTDGAGFTVLHSFTAASGSTNSDGLYPETGLAISGTTLFGTARSGGSFGNGTIFSISLGASVAPHLAFSASQKNLVFTWPTNATRVFLQSTTNLAAPVWTTVSLPPRVVSGQNTVTNPLSGTQQFFRLSQ